VIWRNKDKCNMKRVYNLLKIIIFNLSKHVLKIAKMLARHSI